VILRPNLFLQNVPESTIPSIDAAGSFYLNAGNARISMVDTRAVAAVASTVLTEVGHAGLHYDLPGPEALSYRDVATKLWMLPMTRSAMPCSGLDWIPGWSARSSTSTRTTVARGPMATCRS
jgi:uncharacterized protein YbjT (DUF2867 family)